MDPRETATVEEPEERLRQATLQVFSVDEREPVAEVVVLVDPVGDAGQHVQRLAELIAGEAELDVLAQDQIRAVGQGDLHHHAAGADIEQIGGDGLPAGLGHGEAKVGMIWGNDAVVLSAVHSQVAPVGDIPLLRKPCSFELRNPVGLIDGRRARLEGRSRMEPPERSSRTGG